MESNVELARLGVNTHCVKRTVPAICSWLGILKGLGEFYRIACFDLEMLHVHEYAHLRKRSHESITEKIVA